MEALEVKNSPVPGRDIGVITQEIQELCRQAKTMVLMYAVEIGRRLVEAKEVLPHGAWGAWIRENTEFSQSTANNYMKLFDEYGASQITIFGATVNSQSLANLPYTKALALLAVDSDEREEFAEQVGAEDLSVKELEKVIHERDEARERAAAYKAQLGELERAKEAAASAAESAEQLGARVAELEQKLEKEKGNSQILKNKLSVAKDNPKIPPEKLEALKREAEEAARKELSENTAKELEEARAALTAAEQARAEAERAQAQAEQSLADAQKRLRTASPEVNTFKTLFESLQECGTKCLKQIEKIRESDAESADKLSLALRTYAERLSRC